MTAPHKPYSTEAPFDWRKLDSLMEQSGIDVLLVTSKHNIQYMLGGYRFFFFDTTDAIGVSRYLPILVYAKGRLDQCIYVGNAMEAYERELGRFWLPTVTSAWGTQDAMAEAIRHVQSLGRAVRRIGVESAFLPADAYKVLESRMGDAEIVDALVTLERLRMIKTPEELALLRRASECVVESMLAVFGAHEPGVTKRQLAAAMSRELQLRQLGFDYCLVTAGLSFNRAPSDQRWEAGEIASLDSGGNLEGYIGDLCRMGVMGEPDSELQDLLAEVDAIQMAARKEIRPGAAAHDILSAGQTRLDRSPHRERLHFVAHGMGVVSHEAPRITDRGAVPYPADDADAPLQEGMVISIETTLLHLERGFIKLEDTLAVTATGYEAYGDAGRGWNRGGSTPA